MCFGSRYIVFLDPCPNLIPDLGPKLAPDQDLGPKLAPDQDLGPKLAPDPDWSLLYSNIINFK